MTETERLKAACDLLMQEVVRLQYALLNARLDAQEAKAQLAARKEADEPTRDQVVSINR